MISSLITALHANDIEPTAEELADALWFAMQIKPLVAPVIASEKISQLPQSETLLDEPIQEVQNSEVIASETVKSENYPVVPNTSKQTGSSSGLPIRVPATNMLPGVLSLERALRPLIWRVESRTQYVLDEAATVQQIAEQDTWLPVLQGVAERWFEVVLVIDQSASMMIWQPTIVEWSNLLQRHGAFRNVRSVAMKYETQSVQLYAGSWACNPHELVDSLGRRLILVVSDCVSSAWYSGAITKLLELWGKSNPVAIINMLPQRLWTGSGLGEAMRVNLRAAAPGLANALLTVDDDLFADDLPNGMKMPVVTLEPELLHFWARSLMGKAGAWISGVIFEPSAGQEVVASAPAAGEISAKQRLQRFYATASPTAQELAEYLAAAPLTLPVMRLVQRVMLPESRQVHLAEVFLGGLIKRVSEKDYNPMVMEYDFYAGVRDLLLKSVLLPDAVDVLKEVSWFLEKRLGNPLDFMALLVDPKAIDGVVIDEKNRAFAEIGMKVLGRLGGEYGKFENKLRSRINVNAKFEIPVSLQQAQLPPSDIITAFKDKRVTLFIGPQCAEQAGFPSQATLQAKMLKKLRPMLNRNDEKQVKSWQKQADGHKRVAEKFKLLATNDYRDFMQEIFNPDSRFKVLRSPDYFAYLGKLPLKYIVTTNLDKLLEDSLPRWESLTWQDKEDFPRFLRDDRPLLLHLFGRADRFGTVVYALSDYKKLFTEDAGLTARDFVLDIFKATTVLLIGYDLNDPLLTYLQKYIFTENLALEWRILLANPTIEQQQIAVKQQIKILPCSHVDDWFSALAKALHVDKQSKIIPEVEQPTDWTQISHHFLEQLPPVSNTVAQNYYQGYSATWNLVKDGYTVRRAVSG